MTTNPLMLTDVYKLGHMEQVPEDTEYVYSYLTFRQVDQYVVFALLRYYLERYLTTPVTREMVQEFLRTRVRILGPTPPAVEAKLNALADLGYIPLRIKAVPEGTIFTEPGHIVASFENTVPGFGWVVGYFESLLLKVWYPSCVATLSRKYKDIAVAYGEATCDNLDHIPYAVHDFGYRGSSSEETALIGGSAHLMNFLGSDTVVAHEMLDYYGDDGTPMMLSVPASEHSVMCAFGRENEFGAYEHMLDTYPNGIASIVSDTYDIYNVITNYGPRLRDRIMARDGKIVFRPDSGDPLLVLCGDRASKHADEQDGVLELLLKVFGGETNSKGYWTLNPHVGVIYGDGMWLQRYQSILHRMMQQRMASSNLVIGVGGLLLQHHNRDDIGAAIKSTNVVIGGESRDIVKNPRTDHKKASLTGRLALTVDEDGQMHTGPESAVHLGDDILRTVYFNGMVVDATPFQEMRDDYQAATAGKTSYTIPEPIAPKVATSGYITVKSTS